MTGSLRKLTWLISIDSRRPILSRTIALYPVEATGSEIDKILKVNITLV